MWEHALVIGGSVAGRCAASALASSFRRVTALDQDRFPTAPELRRGVPRARHVLGLLVRGRQELERHFSGFRKAMIAGGALDVDFGESFAVLRPSRWVQRARFGLITLRSSRGLLRRIENVAIVEESLVESLLVDGPRVTGVRARTGREHRDIKASLVVDASGRGSLTPRWLGQAGAAPPHVEEVDADVGYGSRWYRRLPAERRPREWWWKGRWVEGSSPHVKIGGTAFPIEGDRVQITLVGFNGDHPPSDDHGFLRFLRRLRTLLIAELAERLEPVSPIYSARKLVNCFRRYDRWAAPLSGFAAIGDAVCSFKPVYGQGIAAAARCAALVREQARSFDGSPAWMHAFHRAQAKVLAPAWALATGADFQWPLTRRRRPLLRRVLRPYLLAVLDKGWGDPEVHAQVQRVLHMLEPASTHFQPWLVKRVVASRDRWLRDRERAARGFADSLPPATMSAR